MLKILSKIFSRMVIVILLLLIQVLLLVLVIYIAATSSERWGLYGYLALNLIAFILFLHILGKKEPPENKIPWFFLLMLFPVTGLVIYLFFANHGLSKKDQRILNDVWGKISPYVVGKKEDNNKSGSDSYSVAVNYLSNISDVNTFTGNKITYYECGEKFFPEMIERLKEAKEFIFMEFFIVKKGIQWTKIHEVLKQKVKEGVEVRLLYDDIGCLGAIPSRYWKTLRKEGIKCYNFSPFRPILSGVFNNRDHRKICVIDHKYGFTGGINIGDEYSNDVEEFGYWKDAMIKIEGPAIANLIVLFLLSYDKCAYKMSDYAKYLDYKYEQKGEAFAIPFGDGPAPFYPEYVGEQNYINLINSARKTVYISTPYLIPTFNLITSLRNAALRGVEVNLIVPGIPDKKAVYLMAKSNFKYLVSVGVKVYTYTPGFNHEKAICVDDETVFIGTINMDYRSLVHHYECGVTFTKSEAVHDINNDLIEMTKVSHLVTLKDCKANFFVRFICSIMNIFAPLL